LTPKHPARTKSLQRIALEPSKGSKKGATGLSRHVRENYNLVGKRGASIFLSKKKGEVLLA